LRRLPLISWCFLAVGLAPIVLPYLLALMLLEARGDPDRRGMAEIHLLNESGQDVEVLTLETGSQSLFWHPTWNVAERRWVSASPTVSPLRLERHAWTRTPLLTPGDHELRLTVRLEPDRTPVTISTAYLVEHETFCTIRVRLDQHAVSISRCAPMATMIGEYPDL
jgi:hypothetical protein